MSEGSRPTPLKNRDCRMIVKSNDTHLLKVGLPVADKDFLDPGNPQTVVIPIRPRPFRHIVQFVLLEGLKPDP